MITRSRTRDERQKRRVVGRNLLLYMETDVYRQSKVWHESCDESCIQINANLSSTRIPNFVIRAKDSMARVNRVEHLGE